MPLRAHALRPVAMSAARDAGLRRRRRADLTKFRARFRQTFLDVRLFPLRLSILIAFGLSDRSLTVL